MPRAESEAARRGIGRRQRRGGSMPQSFNKQSIAAGWTIVLMLAIGSRAFAHHSFAAEFDDTQPLKLTGTISKVEWSNPHIWYYVDVKNADGTVTTWALSGGAPGQLMRRGITKDLLQVGSTVVVEGFRAKDG